jgi:hypothetical protein
MPKSKSSPARRPAGTGAVTVTDPTKAIAAISQSGVVTNRLGLTPVTVVTQQGGAVMASHVNYRTRDRVIPDAEVFFVEGEKPAGDDPSLGEADKVAWRDAATGYECIMLREPNGGYLGGYVGIPKSHPLYGFEHEAVPADIGIEVHGGLSYSRICNEGPSPKRSFVLTESRRICHTYEVHYKQATQAGDYRVEDAHAWWFGFDCNHVYDRGPEEKDGRGGYLSAETAATYRDDTYVMREILNLAAQLKAIADGDPVPPRRGPRCRPSASSRKEGGDMEIDFKAARDLPWGGGCGPTAACSRIWMAGAGIPSGMRSGKVG